MSALASPGAGWVEERTGSSLVDLGGPRPVGDLVRLALRRNPRRAHLLVSPVLGKHIPADPREVEAAGLELAGRVRAVAGDRPSLVLGFAETATGLGHVVAAALDAPVVHSTRRELPGRSALLTFAEEHSHATDHRVYLDDPAPLDGAGVVVLVDDEISTGRTAASAIAALHRYRPRVHYVVAALVDLRGAGAEESLADTGAELGTRISVVSLGRGELRNPPTPGFVTAVPERAPAATMPTPGRSHGVGLASPIFGAWPPGTREGGRLGFTREDGTAARTGARRCAAAIRDRLAGQDVLILGTEELMYAPLLCALELQAVLGAGTVRLAATTRSPIVVIDEPGYPVRSGLRFPASDDTGGERYAYNVGQQAWSDIVVVVDEAGHTAALAAPGGLLPALAPLTARTHVLVLPAQELDPLSAGSPA